MDHKHHRIVIELVESMEDENLNIRLILVALRRVYLYDIDDKGELKTPMAEIMEL